MYLQPNRKKSATVFPSTNDDSQWISTVSEAAVYHKQSLCVQKQPQIGIGALSALVCCHWVYGLVDGLFLLLGKKCVLNVE